MAFQMLERIYLDQDIPQRAKTVYLYLISRMDKKRICWPGIARIGSDLSLSRSTVKRAIKDLEKACYIRVEEAFRGNGSYTSNRYHIL
jgi:DNA-binding MarR family transcriptional regulator